MTNSTFRSPAPPWPETERIGTNNNQANLMP